VTGTLRSARHLEGDRPLKELTDRALNAAQTQGATYADVRIVRRQTQSIAVKNGAVEALEVTEDQGFGVRVIVDGAWGFASSARLEPAEVDRVTTLAVQIARASALVKREDVNLGPPEVHVGIYRTPVQIDPFAIPLEEKIALLLAADKEMRREPAVKVAKSNMQFIRERKTFASSEGSYIEQEIIESGCGLEATAVSESEVQKRSYPNSFGRHQGTAGYELVQAMDLVGNAPRVGAEAVALHPSAPA